MLPPLRRRRKTLIQKNVCVSYKKSFLLIFICAIFIGITFLYIRKS